MSVIADIISGNFWLILIAIMLFSFPYAYWATNRRERIFKDKVRKIVLEVINEERAKRRSNLQK